MKVLSAVALVFIMSSAMANDRMAYIANALNTVGAYVLCEGPMATSVNGQTSFQASEHQLNDTLAMVKSETSFKVSDLVVSGNSKCVLLTKK